jgi:CTP:molybdopterin cytidylyltransferase MocA
VQSSYVVREFSVVLLAAGGSRRMGKNKLAIQVWGEPLLHWSLRAAIASGGVEVIVVVGHEAEQVSRLVAGGVRIVFNEAWEEGIASSIRTGIREVSADSRAAVILGGDQPLTPSPLIAMLARLVLEGDCLVASASVAGDPRNPACFHRDLFPKLLELRGDQGARQVVLRNLERAALVEVQPELLIDVDTPEDLERLRLMRPPT